jgi:hypothetical protein
MERTLLPSRIPAAISPAQHAVLDYGVAATFLGAAVALRHRHRRAAALAFMNGAMVLGMSLLTNYPGGVYRALPRRRISSAEFADPSHRGHRAGGRGGDRSRADGFRA